MIRYFFSVLVLLFYLVGAAWADSTTEWIFKQNPSFSWDSSKTLEIPFLADARMQNHLMGIAWKPGVVAESWIISPSGKRYMEGSALPVGMGFHSKNGRLSWVVSGEPREDGVWRFFFRVLKPVSGAFKVAPNYSHTYFREFENLFCGEGYKGPLTLTFGKPTQVTCWHQNNAIGLSWKGKIALPDGRTENLPIESVEIPGGEMTSGGGRFTVPATRLPGIVTVWIEYDNASGKARRMDTWGLRSDGSMYSNTGEPIARDFKGAQVKVFHIRR